MLFDRVDDRHHNLTSWWEVDYDKITVPRHGLQVCAASQSVILVGNY